MENSIIIKNSELPTIKEWIDSNNKDKLKFNLLYRASLHGDRAADFHRLCDNKGPTLSVIEATNGRRFGGFTKLNWDQSQNYKQNDTDAFIFSLDFMRKYIGNGNENHIYCNSTKLITFGSGHDISIADYIGGTGSYSNFPYTYGVDEKFEGRSQLYLSGGYNFIVKDIEVFSVNKY